MILHSINEFLSQFCWVFHVECYSTLMNHLSCSQFFCLFFVLFCFAITDDALNIALIDLSRYSFPWISVLGVELLDLRVCIYSNSLDNNEPFSNIDTLIHTPTKIAFEFLLLSIFANSWYCQILKILLNQWVLNVYHGFNLHFYTQSFLYR